MPDEEELGILEDIIFAEQELAWQRQRSLDLDPFKAYIASQEIIINKTITNNAKELAEII